MFSYEIDEKSIYSIFSSLINLFEQSTHVSRKQLIIVLKQKVQVW